MYCTVLFASPENSCYSIKGLLIEDALEQKYSVIGKLKYFINNSYTSREEISHLSIFFLLLRNVKKKVKIKIQLVVSLAYILFVPNLIPKFFSDHSSSQVPHSFLSYPSLISFSFFRSSAMFRRSNLGIDNTNNCKFFKNFSNCHSLTVFPILLVQIIFTSIYKSIFHPICV